MVTKAQAVEAGSAWGTAADRNPAAPMGQRRGNTGARNVAPIVPLIRGSLAHTERGIWAMSNLFVKTEWIDVNRKCGARCSCFYCKREEVA
jgi:hypothetical protein